MLQDIAESEGDLTMRLIVSTRDELAELVKWFNVFVDKLQGIIKCMIGYSDAIRCSSSSINDILGVMSRNSSHSSGGACAWRNYLQ